MNELEREKIYLHEDICVNWLKLRQQVSSLHSAVYESREIEEIVKILTNVNNCVNEYKYFKELLRLRELQEYENWLKGREVSMSNNLETLNSICPECGNFFDGETEVCDSCEEACEEYERWLKREGGEYE